MLRDPSVNNLVCETNGRVPSQSYGARCWWTRYEDSERVASGGKNVDPFENYEKASKRRFATSPSKFEFVPVAIPSISLIERYRGANGSKIYIDIIEIV